MPYEQPWHTKNLHYPPAITSQCQYFYTAEQDHSGRHEGGKYEAEREEFIRGCQSGRPQKDEHVHSAFKKGKNQAHRGDCRILSTQRNCPGDSTFVRGERRSFLHAAPKMVLWSMNRDRSPIVLGY